MTGGARETIEMPKLRMEALANATQRRPRPTVDRRQTPLQPATLGLMLLDRPTARGWGMLGFVCLPCTRTGLSKLTRWSAAGRS